MFENFHLFLGRFHPLVLHLPIGILAAVFVLELAAWRGKLKALQVAVPFLLKLAALTAFVSAALGYMLAKSGDYDPQLVDWHQWSGFALVVATVALLIVRQRDQATPAVYRGVLLTTAGLLGLTGHLGGSLTHGSGYLMTYFPGTPTQTVSDWTLPDSIQTVDEARVFDDLIMPLVTNRCGECHSPEKQKGELTLTTKAGWDAGGSEGPLLVAGDAFSSLFFRRIILPRDHEEAMPPEGKRALTAEEVALLGWWINEGAAYDSRVADLSPDPTVAAALETLRPTNPLLLLDIDSPSPSRLEALRAEGIPVAQLAEAEPFVSVRLTHRSDIDGDLLKRLQPVADQVTELYLGHSNVDDNLLSELGTFKHLQRLHVENTAITDDGLRNLEALPYLASLNLYGTAITDAGLEHVAALPHLKDLYVWQTDVSTSGVERLLAQQPRLHVERGIDVGTLFGDAQLGTPQIIADKTLFSDSLRVTLDFPLQGAELYYTLDGSEPTEEALRYADPLLLTGSTVVKVQARKEGWADSDVAISSFVKVGRTVESFDLRDAPAERYEGNGAATLIDLTLGDQDFRSGAWLGFEGGDLYGTLDLGDTVPVQNITVSCLEDVNAWIFFPVGLTVSVSTDGRTFQEVGTRSYPSTADFRSPSIQKYILSLDAPTDARYVRVHVRGQRTLPDWHPNSGSKAWLFVDEVFVD